MSCQETVRVRRLLNGGLGREETLAAMDHVRHCLPCRRMMTEESRLGARRGHLAEERLPAVDTFSEEARERSAQNSPGGHRAAQFGVYRPPASRRKSLVRLALLGAVILLLMGGQRFFRSDRKIEVSARDLLVAEALTEGRPFLDSPRGVLANRPKILSLILPPGERRFQIRVLADGKSVYSAEYLEGETGVNFERREVPRPAGALPAREAIIPFPGADALPLEKGREYFWLVELANGNQSAPAPLRIR